MLEKINKVRYFFSKIEQHVPYIPDFSNYWSLLKVLFVSLFFCIIYSFTQIQGASQFYVEFWKNVKTFSPYILTQLILLYVFAQQISRMRSTNAIFFILFLNFLCVYGISSANDRSLEKFFLNWDVAVAKFCVSFGLLFFFLIYFDWREKNIHPSHIKAKLSFLQSKMHPHFLFNTLNSIMSLIKREPDKAKKMLANLATLLRASLKEDANSVMGKFKDELQLCNQYLEIEQMRLGDRLKVVWEIDEKCLDAQLPKLTIQPLLENSILHGIQNLMEGGVIDVKIQSVGNRIKIAIKNPRLEPTEENKRTMLDKDGHNNISMDNLSQRLNIYFDGDVSFTVREKSTSYEVDINIPYIDNPLKVPFMI